MDLGLWCRALLCANEPINSAPRSRHDAVVTSEVPRRRLAVHVTPRALRAVRDGSPWIFRDAITRTSFRADPGDVAIVFDDAKRFCAAGLWDPDGEIALRVLATVATPIDAELISARVHAAHARRAEVRATGTGYRVVFGESDQLPGLVADRYADTVVLRIYSACWLPWLDAVIDALRLEFDVARAVLRLPRVVAARTERLGALRDGATLAGAAPEAPVEFVENGLVFGADVVRGQKTGFFLDQRDNRARVEALAAGKSVLNVFAYSGGFSVYAARGGAREVVSLDASAAALREAEANFARNASRPPIAACRHETLCGDAFELLPSLARAGRRFDLVVLDPPSFAKRRDEVDGALAAYRRLARLALDVLAPGGVLVACSCSSRVTPEAFFTAVHGAAHDVGRALETIATTGHPPDHPESRELRYLKALVARAKESS